MTDHIVKDGDKVYVFGATSMYEYRWNDVNGVELLDLWKVWQSSFVSEDIKDKLREDTKEKNKPK